ncbi:MAG: triose-phosphate isomerase [Verrucomicrobiota bacterium]
MRTPIIAANWKMNKGPSEAADFVNNYLKTPPDVNKCDVVIAAPFVSLAATAEAVSGSSLKLSAQNMYFEENGAFTGEVSPGMLLELNCEYVIIGHSERRAIFGEDDALLNKKVAKAHEVGLKPIFCIGETLEERDGGQLESVIKRQVEEGLKGIDPAKMPETVVAYEPVWAIGTGRTATPEQAQEAQAFVRSVLAGVFGEEISDQIRIQYGGSVKPGNAAELLGQPDIDGALVGGASLEPESFAGIVAAA